MCTAETMFLQAETHGQSNSVYFPVTPEQSTFMQECYIVSSNKKFSRTLGGHPQITKSEGEGKGSAAEDYKDYMGGGGRVKKHPVYQ